MAEYKSMKYKTRGNASPQGLPRVFFCCAAADFDQLFESITEEILSIQTNAAIWYVAPAEGAMEGESFLEDLSQMQLLVVPVTTAFLRKDCPDPARTVAFVYAMEHHIPVLPLMQEPGLESAFNETCGNLEYLDKSALARDATAIPYKEKLQRFLGSVLVSDELAKRVRDAFDAYIFLSYRKKDRAAAQKIMRLIHENEFCRDVAIWYDEFLTPGENFNHAISEAMEKSALFALVVTPHLLENPNYILTTEYPAARDMNKAILPFEVERTDAAELERLFEGLRKTISPEDPETIKCRLQEILDVLALRENNDPVHTFLMGIAYLSGVDVEIDHDRAVNLITEAANMGLPEAIQKMVSMYQTGEGVNRDYSCAIDWQKKLISQLKYMVDAECTEDNLAFLCDEWANLCFFYRNCEMPLQANNTYFNLINYIQTIQKSNPEFTVVTEKTLERCYRGLAASYDLLRDRVSAKEWLLKAIEIEENSYRKDNSFKNVEMLELCYREMGYISLWIGSQSDTLSWFEKAIKMIEHFDIRNIPIFQADLGHCYIGISHMYSRKGDRSTAEKWVKKATEIFENLVITEGCSEFVFDLAFSYEKLGNVLEDGAYWYKKAISYYSSLIDSNGSLEAYRRLSFCVRQIVSKCRVSGDYETCEQYLLMGIETLEKLLLQTKSPADRKELAGLYEEYGLLFKKRKDYEHASEWYLKSVDQLEKVVADVDTFKTKRSLYWGYCKLRDLYLTQENYAGALLWNQKGIQILNQLMENPERDDVYGICRDQIKCYQIMGNIVEHLDETAASEWYQKSVLLCENINDEFHNPEIKHYLYIGYEKVGDYKRKKDPKEAELWYQKAYALYKTKSADKEKDDRQRNLSVICKKIGNAICEQGRPGEAIKWYQESLEADLALVSQKSTPIAQANLSISYERLGNANCKLGRFSEALKWYRLFAENAELLASRTGTVRALDHLGISIYELASRDWIAVSERRVLLMRLQQIGEELLQKTGLPRYQEFINTAKELLASL